MSSTGSKKGLLTIIASFLLGVVITAMVCMTWSSSSFSSSAAAAALSKATVAVSASKNIVSHPEERRDESAPGDVVGEEDANQRIGAVGEGRANTRETEAPVLTPRPQSRRVTRKTLPPSDGDNEQQQESSSQDKQPELPRAKIGMKLAIDEEEPTPKDDGSREQPAEGMQRRSGSSTSSQQQQYECFTPKGVYKKVVAAWYNGEDRVCFDKHNNGVKGNTQDMSPHTHLSMNVAKYVIKSTYNTGYFVECGSFRGGSAALFIKAARELGYREGQVMLHCMDPFTGDVAMNIDADLQPWLMHNKNAGPVARGGELAARQRPNNKGNNNQLPSRAGGLPHLANQFIANIQALGFEKFVLPQQITSLVGLRSLSRVLANTRRGGVRPDAIYVDSAHERDETFMELSEAYALIPNNGMLMGDDFDYNWPAVVNDVIRFASKLPCAQPLASRRSTNRHRQMQTQNVESLEEDGAPPQPTRKSQRRRGVPSRAVSGGENDENNVGSTSTRSEAHNTVNSPDKELCEQRRQWPVYEGSDVNLKGPNSNCKSVPKELQTVLRITGSCQWIMRKLEP